MQNPREDDTYTTDLHLLREELREEAAAQLEGKVALLETVLRADGTTLEDAERVMVDLANAMVSSSRLICPVARRY